MKLKWIKRMSVGAAIAVLTAFFVVGCGSTEKQNNGSLSTDSSQDISEVSTKQEVPEKSEVPQKSADELRLGVKCQSNQELAGSPRNALRRSS